MPALKTQNNLKIKQILDQIEIKQPFFRQNAVNFRPGKTPFLNSLRN